MTTDQARNTKLHRDVAIKVLPDLVAADHDRRAGWRHRLGRRPLAIDPTST